GHSHRGVPMSLVLGLLIFPALSGGLVRADLGSAKVCADPQILHLSGPSAAYSLLVQGEKADGRIVDLTGAARYRSVNVRIATVTESGVVRWVADGSTAVVIAVAGRTLRVPVHVTGSSLPRRFNFENDVVPLFSRFGCNSSACHGKAEGQNGFKLSVFGFDPPADYAALTKESRGRRVFVAAPEHSLLLTKICGTVAHGGGVRLPRTSPDYETPPRSVA